MAARCWVLGIALSLLAMPSDAAVVQKKYYAYDAVQDKHGVIAPWYKGQNGQLDYRVRIAAETLKRYPWTPAGKAPVQVPEYIVSGAWGIAPDGTITIPAIDDWANGDLGQRSSYVLSGLVDHYAYSGDPSAIAAATMQADYLLDYCQTPADHPWPSFLISVPVKGKPYGQADPKGYIQLDIVAEVGIGMLRTYQLTGNKRYFEACKHWADVLAEKRNRTPGAAPWDRYANPDDVQWKQNPMTGGVSFVLYFFDELIRLGYTGKDNAIVEARDAGRAYLRDVLLPKWTTADTWGRNYWDWPCPVQVENVTEFACRYMMDNKDYFPNWKTDVRNVMSLFLNHTSVDPNSGGEVYSGAWAYPESSGCCGRSLWYGPMEVSWAFAQYGVEADSEWAREIARRSQILATYDIHETGYSEDGIDGGPIVNSAWFKIAHPMALKHLLKTIGWMPEVFGASGENHIVRSTSVVTYVSHLGPQLHYTTFDAPRNTVDVLRLACEPKSVSGLTKRDDLKANGYTVRKLPDGNCIVAIRHDGVTRISVTGKTWPMTYVAERDITFKGPWTSLYSTGSSGAELSCEFNGSQVQVIGDVGVDGGLADVYLDGKKQAAGIDCWAPSKLSGQMLFWRSGLAGGKHTLRIVVKGEKNPRSNGTLIHVYGVQYSNASGTSPFGEGGGPKDAQRWVFGYAGREDLKDSKGNTWRPATEVVVRLRGLADSVAQTWWTEPVAEKIEGTSDPELYRYGVHARDFTANYTVGPGTYHVRLKFAATRGIDTAKNPFSVAINGEEVVPNLDVAATAGGSNHAVDLVFNGIKPRNGAIDIRFTGASMTKDDCVVRNEAFVQAIEVGPGDGGKGAKAVTVPEQASKPNLLRNPGFEDGAASGVGVKDATAGGNGWSYQFVSPSTCYIWPESEYANRPEWGLPEFHCGRQAMRTHTDANGHTRIYQEVEVASDKEYAASVWVRAVDLRGKGFGTAEADSAALIVQEFDKDGKLVIEHPKAEVKKAGPYVRLERTFKAGPLTRKARFVLDTVIACHYAEGHVTYDDAMLTPL